MQFTYSPDKLAFKVSRYYPGRDVLIFDDYTTREFPLEVIENNIAFVEGRDSLALGEIMLVLHFFDQEKFPLSISLYLEQNKLLSDIGSKIAIERKRYGETFSSDEKVIETRIMKDRKRNLPVYVRGYTMDQIENYVYPELLKFDINYPNINPNIPGFYRTIMLKKRARKIARKDRKMGKTKLKITVPQDTNF